MAGIIDSLLPAIDSILGVRDSVGAVIQPAYLVTRTWSGAQPGDGTPADVDVQILPSPQIVDLAQNIRNLEGGAIKQGDIMLKNISRNSYTAAQLDGQSSAANIEKFYKVGVKFYTVIRVKESYVTWDVTLRELTNQPGY